MLRRSEDHFLKIREIVAKNLEKAHASSKNRYDLRSRPVAYTVGETVWRKTFPLSDANKGFMAKLAPKYQRCVIRRKIGFGSYELADESGKILGTFSTKYLKKN